MGKYPPVTDATPEQLVRALVRPRGKGDGMKDKPEPTASDPQEARGAERGRDGGLPETTSGGEASHRASSEEEVTLENLKTPGYVWTLPEGHSLQRLAAALLKAREQMRKRPSRASGSTAGIHKFSGGHLRHRGAPLSRSALPAGVGKMKPKLNTGPSIKSVRVMLALM